jgi:ketosteroid isomerase-like protein
VFSVFLLGCAVGAIVACLVTFLVLRQFGALTVAPGPGGSPAASPGPPRTDSSSRPADARNAGPSAERRALEQSLRDWLDATRRRDLPGQMRFYPARVPVFYAWRDVPKERVRYEKMKVIGRARVVDIETDPPEIVFQNDGREAIMQFRKRYTIVGPGLSRRGEVLQELRWTRGGDGWKIVGERDAAVLSSAPR